MRPIVTDRVAWSVGLSVYWSVTLVTVLCTQMRPIVTDRVALSVGLSVTVVSPAKTATPIEMPFGLRTWVGPRNHVLDGGPQPHVVGRGNFEGGKGCPKCCKV